MFACNKPNWFGLELEDVLTNSNRLKSHEQKAIGIRKNVLLKLTLWIFSLQSECLRESLSDEHLCSIFMNGLEHGSQVNGSKYQSSLSTGITKKEQIVHSSID